MPLPLKSGTAVCRATLAGVAALWLTGCATPATPDDDHDPWEAVNRKIYSFNESLDKAVLKPVADGYVSVTSQPVRTGVTNFFNNAASINVIVNDLLQGQGQQMASDSGRFVVNSSLGVLGIFDPATGMGLKPHDTDFGITLGKWGAGSGPYIMLPVLGPSNVRDSPSLAVTALTSPFFYIGTAAVTIPLSLLDAVNSRANASSSLNFVDEAALDPYSFIRSAYTQHRLFLITGEAAVPAVADPAASGGP